MKKIIIEDYYDFNFPSDLVSEDNLAFHGTGKAIANLIEKRGFMAGIKPYEISDIRFLIESYHLLGYGKHVMPEIIPQISDLPIYNTGYGSLATYVLIGNRWRGFKDITSKYPSFTRNYWQAGDYSTKQGGETIKIFVRGIMELISLITSSEKLAKHQDEIKTKSILANFDGDESQESILKRIHDVDFLIDLNQKLNDLHDKKISVLQNETYGTIFENHEPEIIAVKITPDNLQKREGKIVGFKNDLTATSDIPPENIVARISFKQGHRIPLPWDIIRSQTSQIDPEEVKIMNINEKIVAKYGEAIEDPNRWHFDTDGPIS